ncbi:MAG: CpsD/CapB family tyrosine-protein kinase [Candidatus Eisenbacteria bacterium]|nr:CpsD/CapB family tyrosine-protein kinase [Candidatus Eisenbacteria bacterium]
MIPEAGLHELAGVRRRVEAQLPGRSRFALGMLGSVRGEGATTTVLGYARTLAADGRLRILMVDAEGTDRTISSTWADPGAAGWSDLASPAQVTSVVRGTPLANLQVLPFGSRNTASPAQLAELLIEATRQVAQQYDYVLFDLGSVLQTPTAHYLAGAMDGILLVVHASGTRREICQKAVEELRKTDTPVLGVVLNRRRYVIPEAVYKRI